MAAPSSTVWGSIAGSYGKIGIYVGRTTTSTTATVNVQVWFWSKYSVSDSNNNLYFDIRSEKGSATSSISSLSINTTVASGAEWNTANQVELWSKSYTYTRTTSAATKYLYAKLTDVDRVNAQMLCSTTVSIPRLDSYTVSYNANGGSGAPSNQTKWFGIGLTLSSAKPTRTGYAFLGWSTSASGGVNYAAGSSYTGNADLVLYAVWSSSAYTVSYNANGGSGAPGSQSKAYAQSLILSTTKPTRTGYVFKGWGTSASTTTVAYNPGDYYVANASITLYAIWAEDYTKPRITNLSVTRCTSANAASDTGTYALVNFSWACDKSVSSIKIEWKLASTSSWSGAASASVSTSSTSVSQRIGSNDISADNTYDIRVTVTDAGGSSTASSTLSGAKYVIDILKSGAGISFGKPAELSNYMDVGYSTRFRGNVVSTAPVQIQVTTDASGTANNSPALSIGDPTGLHIEIDGNEVMAKTSGTTTGSLYINSDGGNVYINGCLMAKNKVLWSGEKTSTGGWYMQEGQTVELSEAISTQANGIVLVWSYYDGEAQNSNWNMQFIPKYWVSVHGSGGNGVSALLTTATGSYTAIKYVYVNDAIIGGYVGNNAEPKTQDNGILTTPKRFVLRYVIGV